MAESRRPCSHNDSQCCKLNVKYLLRLSDYVCDKHLDKHLMKALVFLAKLFGKNMSSLQKRLIR